MLVAPDGTAAPKSERLVCCSQCGAPAKEFQSVKMFGDFWKTLCMKCGNVITEGCGNVPEGVT